MRQTIIEKNMAQKADFCTEISEGNKNPTESTP